jgi:hypothetical protein
LIRRAATCVAAGRAGAIATGRRGIRLAVDVQFRLHRASKALLSNRSPLARLDFGTDGVADRENLSECITGIGCPG